MREEATVVDGPPHRGPTLLDAAGVTSRHVRRRGRTGPPPLVLGPAAGTQVEVSSGVAGGEEIVADAASATHAWRRDQNVRVKKD